jgi:hypothetical protein
MRMVSEHAMRYNADNIVYIPWVRIFNKRIKFEKLSDPNIAFPQTLHEKNPTSQLFH